MEEHTIIVNADFLVSSLDNRRRLFLMLEDYPELSVIVLSVALKQACEVKNISFKDISTNLKRHRITIISRDNLNHNEQDQFLAQQEFAKNLVINYDPNRHFSFINEVAYAILRNVKTIVVSNEKDCQLKEPIDDLNIWSLKKLKKQYPPRWIKRLIKWIKNNKIWSFLLLVLITFSVVVVIPKIIDIVVFHPYCPLDNSNSNFLISCGESILITKTDNSTSDFDLFYRHQDSAADFFQKSKYEDAVTSFKKAFPQYKSPETLIYLNNALLEANSKKANTIAVTVPSIKAQETAINQQKDLAKEILRGVAQVQTLVNKCLLSDEFDFLPNSIKNNNNLCQKIQEKGKGLRVIIADDANNQAQAKDLADKLNKLKDKSILAVIGHNSSDICNAVIEEYNKNNLLLISFGSTSISDTKYDHFMHDDFFFRTVPDDNFTVKKLIEYLEKADNSNLKKAAIFYNKDSIFSGPLYGKFKKEFAEKGISGRIVEEFAGKDNDSTSFTGKNFNVSEAIKKSQNADVIILFPDGETSESFNNAIKIMKANKGNKPILGTWDLRSNRFLQAAKETPSLVTNKKIIVYSIYDSSQTPNKQYVEEGEALWGDASPLITATSYDAAWVLVNAFLINPNRTNLKDTLNKLRKIRIENGATGTITFDENGNRNNLEGLLLEVIEDKTQPSGLKFVPIK
jgi:branched-chain amino acid transport system substrate-binding protein